MVALKNYGLGPRGIHDVNGKLHMLAIGEEKEVELADGVMRQLRQSQKNGDTLHIQTSRSRKDGEAGKRQDAALAILEHVPELSYLELLSECKTVLDANYMPPRPTRGDIIRRLAEAANGEETDHPDRFTPAETPKQPEEEPAPMHPLRERQLRMMEESHDQADDDYEDDEGAAEETEE